MERVGFRYTVCGNIRFNLSEIERLEQFVLISPDCKIKSDIINLVRAWRNIFDTSNLSHSKDELEFLVTADDLHFLVNVLPHSTKDVLVSTLRDSLIDAYSDVMTESQYRNHTEPWEKNQPWYIAPLQQIADSVWWVCNVAVSPVDGFVTVYADGFPQLKCKFRPRMGKNVNMFEVVVNAWSQDEAAAWRDWRKGSVHTLDEFIAAMDRTRTISNSKLQTWDDKHKCFVPSPQGEIFVSYYRD